MRFFVKMNRKDGKLLAFIDRKCRSLFTQKIKAQRLRWTQAWRRRNKKSKAETLAKKKVKRVGTVFKAIQGLSIEEIRKRRSAKPDVKKANREVAVREIKERKKKVAAEKKTQAKKKATTATAAKGFVKVPKQRQALNKANIKR